MSRILNIDNSSFKQNSYGNIQRLGVTVDNRTLYRVIDSQGDEAGKLSVPQNQSDTFESAYRDIMEAAPKIQKYALEHSTDEDIKRRRNLSRLIVGVGGLAGVVTPLALTWKSSTIKKILSVVVGIVGGLSAGFAASIAATTPPGTFKFAKATRTFSKLDIKPIQDSYN